MSEAIKPQTRPGHPDGPTWWRAPAGLVLLLAAGLVGWAMLGGIVWLAWFVRVYLVVALTFGGVVAVVAYIAHLATSGRRRSRIVAAVLLAGLVVFVLWVVPQ